MASTQGRGWILLRRFSKFAGSWIIALDGEVGKVHDVYFDDSSWVVRYLVADTGNWLFGRKVLISPQAVEQIDRTRQTVSLRLTRAKIKASPDVDTDKPVSRQHENQFNAYYGYSSYWDHSMQWGTGPMPPVAGPTASELLELQEKRLISAHPGDTHLRSAREVKGYTISAMDGSIGHVEDFLFDDATWAMRHLVVKTGVWLFGRHVMVSRDSVRQVDWAAKSVEVDQTRKQIEHGVEFDPDKPPPRGRRFH
jgi:uncharacterized protein YrrD